MFEMKMFDGGHHRVHENGSQKSQEEDVKLMGGDDEESRAATDATENTSGEDQNADHRSKKKRYHRHTQHQIQEMESFFKEFPHPDDKQRKELGRRLGLEPLQVKFWFQNKRTQIKAHHERDENTQLRNENEKLRAENLRYKEALGNATCPHCGAPAAVVGDMPFDDHHLQNDNARLREEIDRISGVAAKYVGGKQSLPFPPGTPRSLDLGAGAFAGEIFGATDRLPSVVSTINDADKPVIIELAVTAMEELITMAQAGEPLWIANQEDNSSETLKDDEYLRAFPRGIGPRPFGLKSEASRESAVVIMNHTNLVEILMDASQWASVFSSIVTRAMTVEVLSTGVAGNYNGALQVMTAEFQVPSPLVPTRENYFARYCKQHGDGTWAVVDISLDGLRPSCISRCRRRPSGCLIQELPNGYSKVTWVEHVEVDDRGVHSIYKPVVNSSLAFGAKRWVATLDRQCERLASVMANSISAGDDGVISSVEGRKSMLKLAERMVFSFCTGVGASTTHTWTTLSGSGADDVRVMTRKSMDEPGRPPGIVLSVATSFWLPISPQRVFNFLRDENSRSEWDILSNGGFVQEMAHIANGRDPGNAVSLLRVYSANTSQSNMLILQESCTDATCSYVIYAPVDIIAMNSVLSGSGDPNYVALLPSGFAILPDGPNSQQQGNPDAGTGGSLLTVAFQILVDSVPTAKLSLGSVATVNSLIKCTIERIKEAMLRDGPT